MKSIQATEKSWSTTQTAETWALLAQRSAWIVGFSIATALAAQVKVPVPGTTVPMTLQTAVVLLAGLSLRGRDGALSQAIYLLGGALGLPFFASGLSALAGPNGGYLFGFVAAAAFAGTLAPRLRARDADSFAAIWALAFLASGLVFLPGVIQLRSVLGLSWGRAWAMGVAPFIVGDLLKVTLAASAYRLISPRR